MYFKYNMDRHSLHELMMQKKKYKTCEAFEADGAAFLSSKNLMKLLHIGQCLPTW
jgi:hypothetical protein